ncbi:MAG: helix-turn-helix domain-containing protein [Bacillota bacterium]|nr:helix-turn-helix domain-containing protein [Bacillota bacterium]
MLCRICKEAMEPTVVDFETNWRGYRATFKDLPVIKCVSCGHTLITPDAADLMSDLVDAKLAANQPVPEVLTVEEAAEFLKLSTQTVYNLQRAGQLPGAKVGSQIRFLRSALTDLLAGEAPPQAASLQQPNPDPKKIARPRRNTPRDGL